VGREGKSERPWWLTWRGEPPGWREWRNTPLSERRVFWARVVIAVWALFFLLFIAVAVLKRFWFAPVPLLLFPFNVLSWEPMHRRQILGLRPTKQ